MAAELGSTDDPKALIPGGTAAVRATSEAMRRYGDSLAEAGDGLKRIDSSEGWQGEAAEQFRGAFDGEPAKWITAGDSFHHAAGSLENYSQTLTWVQSQAGEAIRLWNEGEAATEQAHADHAQRLEHAQQHTQPDAPAPQIAFHDPGEAKRQAAQAILDRARRQLPTAGDQAAEVVGRARDTAPAERSWIAEAGEAIGDAAATAVNGLAEFGNADLHHPELVAGAVGGAALTAVGSAAMAGGVVLDATGAGAVVGAPVNYLAGAGMAPGGAMAAASVGGLGADAAGEDSVEVVDTSDAEPAPRLSCRGKTRPYKRRSPKIGGTVTPPRRVLGSAGKTLTTRVAALESTKETRTTPSPPSRSTTSSFKTRARSSAGTAS